MNRNIIIIISLFIICIVISLFACVIMYFNNSTPINLKIDEHIKIIQDENSYSYDIDKIEAKKSKVEIYGWALKQDEEIETCETYIVIKNKNNNTYEVFRNWIDKRNDIKDKFDKNEYRYELSGFKTSISKRYLEEGNTYDLFLLYRNNENNVLIDFKKEIEV